MRAALLTLILSTVTLTSAWAEYYHHPRHCWQEWHHGHHVTVCR